MFWLAGLPADSNLSTEHFGVGMLQEAAASGLLQVRSWV